MPATVEEHDPDGVDYAWVMQTTFVLTIVVGAPVVAAVALLTGVSLPTWTAMALFAVRVGALVWFVTAVGVFLYARRTTVDADEERGDETERDSDDEAADDG